MRAILISFIIFLALSLVSGCATPYKKSGFKGGYKDIQLDDNLFNVSFRGNGYTSAQKTKTYFLYRCAELTLEKGYRYFVIESTSADVMRGVIVMPGTYSATTIGSTTRGTYMPGQAIPYSKPTIEGTIRLFKEEKPENLPNAYDAAKLIQYLGPIIERPYLGSMMKSRRKFK